MYVETLADRVNGRLAASDAARAFFRRELRTLDGDLRAALARAANRATRLHIEDVRTRIASALDPAVQAPRRPFPAPRTTAADPFDVTAEPESCWTDFAIERN